jgi:NAD(P)-dependent dehydrogenase (short-subunit alcohol dehydrogenase family)
MSEETGLFRDLNFRLRRVLVTAAAHGFGAAIAERFQAHGASLALADIEEARSPPPRAPRRGRHTWINPILAP